MQWPFFKKNTQKEEVFLGIVLREKEGIGMVMRIGHGKAELVDKLVFPFVNGLDHLIEDVDQVILKLEKTTNLHPSKTIFFIYSHVLEPNGKDIKKIYLQKIKEITKNLELQALGYIEAHEAVSHLIEIKEELVLSALLIELNDSEVTVFVYKRGKKIFQKTLGQTDNLIDDLASIFNEIKLSMLLPSRIILYNSRNSDVEATKILTYRWNQDLFVQLPRVEVISQEELLKGMMGVFSNQISGQTLIPEPPSLPPEKKEVMGFVIGQDVQKEAGEEIEKEVTVTETPTTKEEGEIINPETPSITLPAFSSPRINFAMITDRLTPLITTGKRFFATWSIIVGFILILLAIALQEFFLHKAELTLYLPSKEVQKEINLSASEKSGSDLTLTSSSQSVSVSKSKKTTGNREVGERAKGSVTLHNFDDKEKLFAKGTVLELGTLKFTLDTDTKVASSSVVSISGGLVKQPGKTKTQATASDIGPSSNIDAGKQLKFQDSSMSLYFALSDTNFSGGTRRDVQTVARKDYDDLTKVVQDEAFKNKSQSDEKDEKKIMIASLTDTLVTDGKFSKEVGEETGTLTLTAKATTTRFFYNETDLIRLLTSELGSEVPKEFSLSPNKISYKVEKVSGKGNYTLAVSARASAVKSVSENEVIQKMKGKSVAEVESIAKKSFQAKGIKVNIEPKIFIIGGLMPFLEKNVILHVSSL